MTGLGPTRPVVVVPVVVEHRRQPAQGAVAGLQADQIRGVLEPLVMPCDGLEQLAQQRVVVGSQPLLHARVKLGVSRLGHGDAAGHWPRP